MRSVFISLFHVNSFKQKRDFLKYKPIFNTAQYLLFDNNPSSVKAAAGFSSVHH